MESNRDEAEKCRILGLQAYKCGNLDKAVRLLEKSTRMYPNVDVDAVLEQIAIARNQGPRSANTDSADANPTPPPSYPRARTPGASSRGFAPSASANNRSDVGGGSGGQSSSFSSSSSAGKEESGSVGGGIGTGGEGRCNNSTSKSSASTASQAYPPRSRNSGKIPAATNKAPPASKSESPPEYTPEQVAVCQKVLRAKDYYDMLGIPKNANEDAIKKAYKKLALLLHPDKNKAPSAEDAFKRISRAVQCLTDSNKRSIYDQTGEEEPSAPSRGGGGNSHVYTQDFMTPDELFESLFGMGFRTTTTQEFRRMRRQPTPENQRIQHNLFQLIPLIFVLFVAILGNFYNAPSPASFDFRQSSDYPVARRTNRYHVAYYVPSGFPRVFPEGSDKLRELDVQVEMVYFSAECGKVQRELVRQWQAMQFFSSSKMQLQSKLREVRESERTAPGCLRYRDLKRSFPRLHYVSPSYLGDSLFS